MYMLLFPPWRWYHHNLWSTDGLTILAWIEIVAILVHYQPSYNTSYTMKPSDPLLLADVTLRCRMYPAGKVDISQHLAIPGFPQSDHTVSKPSSDAGSLCESRPPKVILECRPPICLDYRACNRPQLPSWSWPSCLMFSQLLMFTIWGFHAFALL